MGSIKELYKSLQSWFFSFWVTRWRVSILIWILVVVLWAMSLYSIPKESNPEIDFWIITVSIPFPWANPNDIDSLITEKIEQAVESVDWINTITSTSSVWIANITLELNNDTDVTQALSEIKDEVDKVSLPEDAEDPIVTEISESWQSMFQLIIYWDETMFPKERLIDAASYIKNELEGSNGVRKITVQWGEEFDLEVLIDRAVAQELNLSIGDISDAIRSFNRNVPLGQYAVDGLNYDFRIQWELESEENILSIPLYTETGRVITIGDLARVVRSYSNDAYQQLGNQEWFANNAITVNFQKEDGYSIFASADESKEAIQKIMELQQFSWISYTFANDLSELIRDDYQTLAKNWLITLVFVLLCLFVFVWFKEALIATFWIVLAFFITFTTLDTLWLSLNFLTNFSLVLTLWIAIDTAIVIVEAAYENLKIGYKPKTAILIAVRDFKAPLIAWTMTTIVVFIPMMVLPGIIGKFLAYIPITVFITLIAALFIAFTVNAALFYLLSKDKKTYIINEQAEKFLSDEDTAILQAERADKTPQKEGVSTLRQRFLDKFNKRYEKNLNTYVHWRKTRQWSIIIPLLLLIASLIFLSPRIGFSLFPSGDNDRLDFTIEWQAWLVEEEMVSWTPLIKPILAEYEEIEYFTLTAENNTISVWIELLELDERNSRDLRWVFALENELLDRFEFLRQEWLTVSSAVQSGWPPQWSPVALKFTTSDNSNFRTLLETAKNAQDHMRGIQWLKNVSLSSQDTPWQFVYTFNQEALQALQLTPAMVQWAILSAVNWAGAWSLKYQYFDADISVLFEEYSDNLSPTDIQWLVLSTPAWPIKAGELIDYSIDNAVAQITREDGEITVTVSADLQDWFENDWTSIQNELSSRADQQNFPEGVAYKAWGETQENADLIQATIRWFFIAFFLIFGILLLQFNSYRKPLVILYSVFCALLWVNIWLFLTGNPYSMPFAIGFIALTWIVVNDAIVFVDRVNANNKLSDSDDPLDGIIEAWRSRLQPIILTTLTTLLGILPLALEDPFRAWLGFTIIFGLFAWSAMTLFVIPSLYYEVILEKRLTWFKVIFWTLLLAPYGIYLCVKKLRW